MDKNSFIIITSIAPSTNSILNTIAIDSKKNNVHFIIIGDSKSPADFELNNSNYYNIQQQKQLPYKLAKSLPENNYSRKNLGYLLAFNSEAQIIIETDDDNIPLPDFWNNRTVNPIANYLKNFGWVNIYQYFSEIPIWPRGFALDHIQDPVVLINKQLETVFCPIQQGLANGNPDVDAIYRLTSKLSINFNQINNIALGYGTWCPFNSQNTTWFRDAFPLMYLPSFCNFRMTDIWRSFIAQRIAWTNDWNVLFHNATVFQERNEHNILKDFEDEIPGYIQNSMICDELLTLDLKVGKQFLFDNLILCYKKFIEKKMIDKKELALLDDWIHDCLLFF
jgi:hypothetical protein